MKRWFAVGLVLLAAGGMLPAAQAQEEGTMRMLQKRDDRMLAVLPNGLIVLAQRLRTAPVVSAQVWVKTGSIYEQEFAGAGISHFLEHLVSGGSTADRTEDESHALLGRMGARTNAATSLDTVRYYIETTAEHAPEAIELLSGWMQQSTIPEAEFERERQVIQREFAMGRGDPGRIFWRLTQQARYEAHPARHPTIGYLESFLEIERDAVIDFYERMYVPNNMVFVVVGDIDPEAVVMQVRELWLDEARAELPEIAFPVESEPAAPVTVSGTAAISRPRLRLAWPGTRLAAPGDEALDLLAEVLGGGESSRLKRRLRDEAGVVSSIDAYNVSFDWGEGFFGMDAELAVGRGADGRFDPEAVEAAFAEVREAIEAEIDRLAEAPVTAAELERARQQMRWRVVQSSESSAQMAARMARDLIHTGDPDYLDRYLDVLDRLEPDDLAAAAAEFLVSEEAIEVRLEPVMGDAEPEPLAPPEEAAEEAGTLETEPVELDNRALVARFEAARRNTAPGRALATAPIEVRTLENGLRLVTGPSNHVPGIAIHFYHRGGLLAEADGRQGVANAAARMLTRGTRRRGAEAIAEQVERLGATLTSGAGNNTFYVRAGGLSENWADLLDLVGELVIHPSFESSEWEKMKPRILASIDRAGDRWNGELQQRLRRLVFEGHTWATPPTGRRAVVEDLSAADLERFYRPRLGASEAVLAVFGDVDVERVAERAGVLFAEMPSQPAIPFEPMPAPAWENRLVVAKTPKRLAAAAVAWGPGVRIQSADYAGVRVMRAVLSSFPAGWLERELRGEGEGLAYAVGAWPFAGLVSGYFGALLSSQPAQVVEGTRRAIEVVDRLRQAPVEPATLERARARVLVDELFERQTNGNRATRAGLDELYGVGAEASSQRFIREVEAVTPERLQVLAERYLRNPQALIITHEPVDPAPLEAVLEVEPEVEGFEAAR